MPRLARLDAPGVLHHVIIRGIEHRKIFRDNKARNNLLDRLSDLLPTTKTACYAWALLSNHAHFLPVGNSTYLPKGYSAVLVSADFGCSRLTLLIRLHVSGRQAAILRNKALGN